ncbi:MAG: tetratricopeptide repeat protein [Pseudomonadota bacterium]
MQAAPKSKTKYLVGVVVLILLAGIGGFYFLSKKAPPDIQKQTSVTTSPKPVAEIPKVVNTETSSPAPVSEPPSSSQKGGPSNNEARAEQFFNEGKELMKQSNYPEAVISFSKAIELKPEYFQAFFHRGISYHKQKLYELAIQDYTTTIAQKSDYAFPYNNRGNIYLDQKLYDLAILDYSKAIVLKSDYAFPYNNRGLAKKEKGDYTGAVQDFEYALKIDPNYEDAKQNIEKLKKK